jgi:cell shape-determining protein MreC
VKRLLKYEKKIWNFFGKLKEEDSYDKKEKKLKERLKELNNDNTEEA